MNSQLIERRIKIPTTVAGIPMRWEDESTDRYALAQMKEVIKFIEDTTGEKFDEKAFFEVMKQHNKEVRNEFEVWEYAKTPYTAFGNVISPLFHAFYFTFSGGSMPYIDKAAKKRLRSPKRHTETRSSASTRRATA